MNKNIPLLFFIMLLAGCATPQPQAPLSNEKTYDAPKDVVWPLLVSEVGLNYPVKAVEKQSGLLTTDFVTLPAGFNNNNMSRWVEPPHMFLATWNGLRVNLSALVTEPEAGKTHIVIRAHYEAFEDNVSHSWVVCDSNGNLENGILVRIGEQLPPPQANAKPPGTP